PLSGHEAQTAQALADGIGGADPAAPAGVQAEALAAAVQTLRAGAAGEGGFEVVFAPDTVGAAKAGNEARAAANLAIAARNEQAVEHLHYLPTDANVNGIADMGVGPAAGGKSFPEIIEGAKAGEIKAILLHDDNPLLNSPGTADI